jgi:hypothetical protein
MVAEDFTSELFAGYRCLRRDETGPRNIRILYNRTIWHCHSERSEESAD